MEKLDDLNFEEITHIDSDFSIKLYSITDKDNEEYLVDSTYWMKILYHYKSIDELYWMNKFNLLDNDELTEESYLGLNEYYTVGNLKRDIIEFEKLNNIIRKVPTKKEKSIKEQATLEKLADDGDILSQLSLSDKLASSNPKRSNYLLDQALLNFDNLTDDTKEKYQDMIIERKNKLGKYYYEGVLTFQNYKKAAELFKYTSDHGSDEGRYYYGRCLYWGKGIPIQDKKQGYKLIKKSASSGYFKAKDILPKYKKNYKKYRKENEGCYIATAVYGSYDSPQVLILRSFRDNYLAKRFWGRKFISTYYRYSPEVADKLRDMGFINDLVRCLLDKFIIIIQKTQH